MESKILKLNHRKPKFKTPLDSVGLFEVRTISLISILFLLTSLSLKAQSLEEFQRMAVEQNPGLKTKYKEFEAALQKVPQVKSLPDPTFSFGYFISPVETRVGPQRARLSLSQMFPWFGTLREQENAAALMAEANYQNFLDARNRLYYQVSAAYYPLYELSQWKQYELANIELLESYKGIATIKFENGNGSLADVLRVDIMLQEARTNLSILDKKEVALLSGMNSLLNRDPMEKVNTVTKLKTPSLGADHSKDSLYANNPALKELDTKLKASEVQERLAHKQALPKLGVGLDYVLVGQRSDLSAGMAAPADNGKNVLMPMVSMSLPIFRKKYKAAIREASLMQEKYALQKADYSNTLASSYDMSSFKIQQQTDLIGLYEGQIATSGQVLNLLFSAYSNAGKNFEEVLLTQQQILKYQKMKATAEMQYHIALAELNYLTAKEY
ncbi:MAG: TolC family protein [Cyclobacteriaceae bacterium]